MTEFIPILVVSILVLLALIVSFGGVEWTDIEQDDKLVVISDLDDYTETDHTVVTLGGNFTVSHISESQRVASIKGEFTKGLTTSSSASDTFKLNDVTNIDVGVVKIKVNDTNYYGSLLVSINGRKVWAEYAGPGEYDAMFSPSVFKRINTVKVSAGGSGWRIWAPTVYVAEVGVYVEYFGVSKKKYEFELNTVPDRARVVVYATGKGSGELEVQLNNFKIYKGYANAYKYFDPDVMHTGTNKVSIIAGENGEYDVESAKLIFWYD